MDRHPLSNLFKRSNYDEPIASESSALDYLYEVLLEIRESKNCDEVLKEEIYKVIHDSSLNEKHDLNDIIINSIMSIVLVICKPPSLRMLVLLCPLLIAMIMIEVIMLLMILKIYLSLMMNMFAIILKVGF